MYFCSKLGIEYLHVEPMPSTQNVHGEISKKSAEQQKKSMVVRSVRIRPIPM